METVYFWLVGQGMSNTQTIIHGSNDVFVPYRVSADNSGMSIKLAIIDNIYIAEQNNKTEELQFDVANGKTSYNLDHTHGTPSYAVGKTWILPHDPACPNITAGNSYVPLPGATACDVTKDITVQLCNIALQAPPHKAPQKKP